MSTLEELTTHIATIEQSLASARAELAALDGPDCPDVSVREWHRAKAKLAAQIQAHESALAEAHAEHASLEREHRNMQEDAEIEAFEKTETAIQEEGKAEVLAGLRMARRGVEKMAGSVDRGRAFAERLLASTAGQPGTKTFAGISPDAVRPESSPQAQRIYRLVERWPTLKDLPLAAGYLLASELE